MKKTFLLLVLFSLGASAQNGDRLYASYKKEGDKAYSEGKYSKAAAQYRSAKQACATCKGIDALIDSCVVKQKGISSQQLNEPSKPTQNTAQTEKYSQPDPDAKQSAEMKSLAPHGQLTQFSNMNYNFVSSRIQTYLHRELNMFTDSNEVGSDYISLQFKEKSSYNARQKELSFIFNVQPAGNDFIVKECRITGDRDKLIKFYIQYWPTTVQVDETKTGLVATTRLLADDSFLYLNGDQSYIEVKGRVTND